MSTSQKDNTNIFTLSITAFKSSDFNKEKILAQCPNSTEKVVCSKCTLRDVGDDMRDFELHCHCGSSKVVLTAQRQQSAIDHWGSSKSDFSSHQNEVFDIL